MVDFTLVDLSRLLAVLLDKSLNAKVVLIIRKKYKYTGDGNHGGGQLEPTRIAYMTPR